MVVVICPGVHEPGLTLDFLQGLQAGAGVDVSGWWVFPADRYPAYSGWHVMQFLQDRLDAANLVGLQQAGLQRPAIAWIGFSAGVVGAIAAAHGWQALGGRVSSLIALDGWGVPLVGNFPIYRLSHDYFTHWSSALLGAGQDSFYAEPGVEHLDLWRSPQTVRGYSISPNCSMSPNWLSPNSSSQTPTTAAQFIAAKIRDKNCISIASH
jgi:hypothetical protein